MLSSITSPRLRGITSSSRLFAWLADLLVGSLDGAELGRIEDLWLNEAKQRRDEVRAGTVKTIPGDQALKQVHKKSRHR